METGTVITIAGLALSIFVYLLPIAKISIKIGIISVILLATIFFLFRQSNHYLHKKHFKPENLFISCMQLAPVLRDSDVFYYKYALIVVNKYQENKDIKELQITFNTDALITSYDIELSDLDKEHLNIDIKDYSLLTLIFDKLKSLEVLAIVINCKLDSKKNYPFINAKDVRYYTVDASLVISYKFFGKYHSYSININPATDRKVFHKDNILLDRFLVVDLRHSVTDYPYPKLAEFMSEDETKSVKVYGLLDKPLLVQYNDSNKIVQYKSRKPLSFFFYPIRIVITKNNDVAIISSLAPFERYEP